MKIIIISKRNTKYEREKVSNIFDMIRIVSFFFFYFFSSHIVFSTIQRILKLNWREKGYPTESIRRPIKTNKIKAWPIKLNRIDETSE